MTAWTRICALADIPTLGSRVVESSSEGRIAVFRNSDNQVFALRDRCPHKAADICKGILGGTWLPSAPGELTFGRQGEIVACPWHGYEYDLATGAELFWPGGTPLRMYPAEEADGRVFVIVPAAGAAG